MRTMIATLAGLVALTSVSAQAVPLAPAKAIPVQFGAGPSIELARQGCGWGWHRGHWRDRWAGIGAAATRIGDPRSLPFDLPNGVGDRSRADLDICIGCGAVQWIAGNHSRRGRCNTAPFYGHYAALRHLPNDPRGLSVQSITGHCNRCRPGIGHEMFKLAGKAGAHHFLRRQPGQKSQNGDTTPGQENEATF